MKTVRQENQLTHDGSQSRSEQQQLESRAKRVSSNFNRPRSSSQVGMLDPRQQSATDTDFDKVNRRLEEFVGYFVKEFEVKLYAYHMILEGEVKKSGKFSDTFSGKIGQGVGGAVGGLVGLLLGSPVSGAKLGAKAGEEGGKKLGSKIGDKQHKKKITNLLGLVDLSQKDKANFRIGLVEAGFDVFQSFEMQFMRVTTDQGPKKAIQQLAKDATNRAINYIEKKGASITEGVIFGKSKREGVSSISPGFEIKYEYLSNKKIWSTTNLYDKVGILVTQKNKPFYHKKKSGSDTGKYGYRRLLISENWDKLKGDYEPDNIVESKSMQFTDYSYILDQKALEQKVKSILWKINSNDKDLEEDRIKKILEEVRDSVIEEVNALKRQSHQYAEDRKILVNIEANLKNVKIDEYLRKFKQDFEEVKQGQQKIVKSIEIGQEENRENFNQLSQKQDIHHDNNKREHKKTQEGVEEVVEVVKDNNKKINEIHEVVVTQKSKQTKEIIWFDVKDPVELFTGREEELDNLHIVLGRSQGRNNPTVISQMTSISGLGGVGKSELARRYAQKYSSNYDGNVIWINAENRGTLESSFLNLAQDNRLGISIEDISGKPKTIESIVKEIYEFFAKRRSLFIFNNAENDNNLKKFLQLCKLRPDASKPYILITSRNREWEKGIEVINLSELKLKDAIEFVKKGLNIGDESQGREIKALVEKLQCFPLAIQQAIAYIEDQRVTGEFSINNYLEKYEKKTKDLLNSDVFGGIDNDYAKTTFTTWQITIDRIKNNKEDGELASKILDVIAYLAPENINREMFLSLAEGDEERLKSAVRLLIKYSMVNGEQKQSVLSIHRLVQEVTRLELKEQNREKDILGKALELISAESTYHVASVWKYVSKYGRLIENFDQELDHTYGYSSATILHLLAENGDHEAIENILKHALNIKNIINAEDKYKRTPLYIAAENGYVNVVELLASKGAKINTKSTIAYASLSTRMASGWTPLHVAAFNGYLKVVELLINKDKALLDIKDSLDRTPLVLAVNAGRLDIARFINPNDDVSLLHIAVQHNGLETVKGLVEKNVSIINSKLGDWIPLHLAAFSGDLSIVKFLIKKIKEQNIEKKDGINHPSNDGFTPLHAASSNGHLEVVKLLISEGANFQAVNKEGWTLLHAAAQNGCLSVVEYLIDEKEFDVNICDGKNDTPLHTAAFHGKLNVVKFLLGEKIKKKADIDFVDTLGATPLLSATLNNNREIIKFLLEEGAKVIDVTDDKTLVGKLQLSVLHVAAMYDDSEMIEYLIDKKGIDKDIGKDISLTPLYVAAFFGSSKAIDCLIKKKSSVDVYVQVSKVKTVFDSVKEDIGLKIPSIGRIVNGLMRAVSYIGDNIQLTANFIYKIRGYPENKLLSRQINNLETYVNRRKDQSSSLPMDAIFFTGEGIHQEEQTLTANECLPGPSHRKKRNAESECLFTWEDVDEFNEDKDEIRDLSKIKIDSEKFIRYLENTLEEKHSQLIQLARSKKPDTFLNGTSVVKGISSVLEL